MKIAMKKMVKPKKLGVSVNTVELAQLVRASDCGSEGRGFEPHIPPHMHNQASGQWFRSLFFYKASVRKQKPPDRL